LRFTVFDSEKDFTELCSQPSASVSNFFIVHFEFTFNVSEFS
jgi:hypothetical protein